VQHNKVGEVKLFSLFGHFSLLLVLGFITLSAQSFEDFKSSQSKSFQTYKDERDNAFNNYLKQHWKAYSVQDSNPLYEKPKPKKIISAKVKPTKSVGPKITIKIKKPVQIEPEQTVIKKPKVTVKQKDINFDFYGTNLEFDIPSGIKKANFYPQNQKGIANFFSSAASSEYEFFILKIQKISKNMKLNDWGTYLLVMKISNMIYSDPDNSKLLSWFIFNKMGYAVKIGLAETHVVLMHYSKKVIYSTPNYSFGKKKYYVISNYAKENTGRIFSYKQDYPGSTKPLDLSLETLPNLKLKMMNKTLEFEQFGDVYSVPFQYNKNLIDFMATYPQANYETFFNAPIDDRTYKTMVLSLKKHIDGKKASDAINFVLSFVQKAFKYERDNQRFGREKVMFAQETLYFDKSDCEDRAVLFSYLVKELFGVGVLGVKYKDHMATALYVPMEGDKIKAGSKFFVLADPTYINATVGMSMLKYKSIKPQSYIIVKRN
jgi:hypothetical protein